MNTDFLKTDVCIDMMKRPWFDLKLKDYAGRTKLYCFRRIDLDTAVYKTSNDLNDSDTQYFPLPLHAAWVITRAKEEMAEKCLIIPSSYTKGTWTIRIRFFKGWASRTDGKGGIKYFPTEPDAVLAAYKYLYPKPKQECLHDKASLFYGGARLEELKEVCPNNPADDAAEKRGPEDDEPVCITKAEWEHWKEIVTGNLVLMRKLEARLQKE